MPVHMRQYTSEPLFTQDYEKVRQFLRAINQSQLTTPGFTWGRWEWMTTHSMLDRSSLERIGLWEDHGEIVGLATYESVLGDAYLFIAQGYSGLQQEMLEYAKDALSDKHKLRVLIDNNDRALQKAAVHLGFTASTEQENTAMLNIDDSLLYSLPAGYRIVSMADEWDYRQYNKVMWRGFNHPGEAPCSGQDIQTRKEMLSSPMIIPELVLAVVAPDGRYVSHCGMWYAPGDSYALVEPVATDPEYRLKGLGKAAVQEAARRCGRLGAQVALVGSSQQFYYNIGFYPVHTGSWWTIRV